MRRLAGRYIAIIIINPLMNGKERKTRSVTRRGRADFRVGKAPCLRASARPEISLREEINFLPGENKFIYGKKFSGMREKIPGLAEAGKTGGGNRDMAVGI